MNVVLTGARLTGGDRLVDVVVRNGSIASVQPSAAPVDHGLARVPLDGRWLMPGL